MYDSVGLESGEKMPAERYTKLPATDSIISGHAEGRGAQFMNNTVQFLSKLPHACCQQALASYCQPVLPRFTADNRKNRLS